MPFVRSVDTLPLPVEAAVGSQRFVHAVVFCSARDLAVEAGIALYGDQLSERL
jgi:hypothetical protein